VANSLAHRHEKQLEIWLLMPPTPSFVGDLIEHFERFIDML